jgi:AraC-like DNA-binding protein
VPQHILYGSFELLSDLIDFYREQNMPKVASHDEQMFLRFYECLVENYNVSREVSFYANKLCVSPKYFSGVIKRETGISAQKWIIDYVVIKAKAMLKHNTEMNIHQVSKAVGFQDQSSFTRFFRNNAGMSPLDYRKDKVIK